MKVRFWCSTLQEIINFDSLSEEEIEKEFVEWLVEEFNAGWEEIKQESQTQETQEGETDNAVL